MFAAFVMLDSAAAPVENKAAPVRAKAAVWFLKESMNVGWPASACKKFATSLVIWFTPWK